MNRQVDIEENYEAEFAARLTAVSSASGRPRYTWHEVEPSFFGVYTDLSNGRSGDDLVNYMVEMNDRAVAVPLVVQARLRGADEQTQVFEFEAPAGSTGGGGGALTVQNKDGTQLGTASSLVLDQTTGLRVLNITSGAANLQNDPATVNGAGVVTTVAQTVTGNKSVQAAYNVPSFPQGGTNTLTQSVNSRIGVATGALAGYMQLRCQVTSGSGAGGDSSMYLAPTMIILSAVNFVPDANGNILSLSGPGVSSGYGGVSLLPSFADPVPRRATLSYTSPNLDLTLVTSGLGQVGRFVIVDNAGTHAGASGSTGGMNFTGGLYTGGTATAAALSVQDEGTLLSSSVTTLNFTGPGVTASGSGATITVNVPAFTSTVAGTVPASGGGTANFLRADGAWAAPPSGGGGSGTVTSVDVSGGSTGLTTSGGPVTASGTITIAGTLAVASGGTGSTSAAAALTALGAAPSSRTISTTAPLAGGGDLTANRTLTVGTFSSSASGIVPSSGGGTTNFLRADGTWAAAGVPGTRAINTTAPLAGGGDLSADRTLSITNFTSSAAGAVPASGGGTSAFLRADGAWAAPPGGGAGNWPVSVQSASFTAAATATSYYCSSASAGITATLPAAAGNAGLRHRFTKTSASSAANLVTVKGNAAESINSDLGAANTLDLYYQADTVTLECDGTGWWVIDDKRRCHVCTAARAAAQSIPDSTVTTIVLDTGVVDGLGLLSGGGISIKRAGRYALSAYWLMQGTNVQLYLVKAGPVTLARHLNTSTAATALIPNTPLGVFTLAAGDTLFLQGFQGGTGAAQNTRTGQDQPLISAQEVR